MRAVLEICANSYQSAVNAEAGGAHRIELCQNLEAGGTTPSFGLIKRVKQKLKIPVYVLIRPRIGDFVYDNDDFELMLEDIVACRALGCEGIAVGVLTQAGQVDVRRLRELVQTAKPMLVTFHRAFDDCHNLSQALEDIIDAGCVRILTSGGADTALDGSAVIARLVKEATGRIAVMPGAGITIHNLRILASTTSASEYHASAKKSFERPFTSRFQATQIETDLQQVEILAKMVNSGVESGYCVP